MSTMSSSSTIVNLMTSRGPVPPGSSLSLLVPQRTNRGNSNSTSEILTGHVLRKSGGLQAGVLHRMINGLQQRSNSRCQRRRWEVDRRRLSVGNPAVRWCGGRLHDRFGLRHMCRIRLTRHRDRIPSDLLANRLRMSERRGDELLID